MSKAIGGRVRSTRGREHGLGRPAATVPGQLPDAVRGAGPDPVARSAHRVPLVLLELRAPRLVPRHRDRVPRGRPIGLVPEGPPVARGPRLHVGRVPGHDRPQWQQPHLLRRVPDSWPADLDLVADHLRGGRGDHGGHRAGRRASVPAIPAARGLSTGCAGQRDRHRCVRHSVVHRSPAGRLGDRHRRAVRIPAQTIPQDRTRRGDRPPRRRLRHGGARRLGGVVPLLPDQLDADRRGRGCGRQRDPPSGHHNDRSTSDRGAHVFPALRAGGCTSGARARHRCWNRRRRSHRACRGRRAGRCGRDRPGTV